MIFLVGFMGSGKTTLGRRLAREMGREFHDTDALVELREGRSIEQIFRESGEGHFRRVEWEALASLPLLPPSVVATGGGLFLGVPQRAWMREHGRTVWLDAPLAECLRRVAGGQGRPLWAAEDPLEFRAFYDKRRCTYALADLRIDVSSAEADENFARLRAAVPLCD